MGLSVKLTNTGGQTPQLSFYSQYFLYRQNIVFGTEKEFFRDASEELHFRVILPENLVSDDYLSFLSSII